MFTEWMTANRLYPAARNLTYAEFPLLWVWHKDEKQWRPRKSGRCIGRIFFCHPSSGEKYYLRMLLNVVKGCTSFEEIRTVNGVIYPTFKQTCHALGFLDDDKEWDECIKEASIWATGDQLRQLFATILTNCEVASPEHLWKENWQLLSEDFSHRNKIPFYFPGMQLSDEQKKLYALLEIEKILNKNNLSLSDIQGMPTPDVDLDHDISNRLIAEELSYKICHLREEHEKLYQGLNEQQKGAYNDILQSVYNDEGKFFFIYGHGGTGKTFLWRTIVARLRSEGRIVLNCASSGIAALLMPGGRTAHSRFKIPLIPSSESTCAIKQGTQLAELIKVASLIIWDEAPMADKACFEALDRTLRDILHHRFNDAENKPFGGITVALGGDFKQILPVIPKGRRADIVNATINSSYLWEYCKVHRLTRNMRLTSLTAVGIEQAKAQEFSDWILEVGNRENDNSDGECWTPILPDLLIPNSGNPLHDIVQSTYPNLENNYLNDKYLIERTILAVRNETVNDINSYILDQLPGEEILFRSSDSISKAGPTYHDQDLLYPIEFLNSLNSPGLPPHQLKLKENIPVMLIRNIDQNGGLCNGTRLIITQLGRWFVEAKIMTGKNIGQKVFIPRITLSPNDSKLPFILKRRQFPLIPAFAMTINKSQGQSLDKVGLCLTKQVFTHGQLYVAISRVTSREGLQILSTDEDNGEQIAKVKNIVYKEIFNNINS